MPLKRKVFISYHHKNDQSYKEELTSLCEEYDLFQDCSVNTFDINEDLPDQKIREIIRDDYLKDTSVTILLVGTETKNRKHVDWEIYSSMFNGLRNKKSGILVIQLPTVDNDYFRSGHGDREKKDVFPEVGNNWVSLGRGELEERYPYLPKRILDNLASGKAKISIIGWNRLLKDISKLKILIEYAASDRENAIYDLTSPMRRANS